MGSTLGREGKIDFDAEAEQVRCSGSMLNYLQTGVVTGDEQISDTHEHTHSQASGCACHVRYESQRRLNIFGLGNNIDENSLFAPGGEKKIKTTLRDFVSGTVSKRRQLVAAGTTTQRRPVQMMAEIFIQSLLQISNKKKNPLSTSNSFLGHGSQKLMQSAVDNFRC